MAEEPAQGLAEQATADMELGAADDRKDGAGGGSEGKRPREEGDGEEEDNDGRSKEQKVEMSVKEESDRIKLGAKEFGSSVEVFDYFLDFLRFWPANINVNKYEHMMLLELIKKGHAEPDDKIGGGPGGVKAFQVQNHPVFKNRCFFIVREDESMVDFSFRKCVDHITPLPEDMKAKPTSAKANRGKGRGSWP